jgi:hypothetical protein
LGQREYKVLYDSEDNDEWGDNDMEFIIPERWNREVPEKGKSEPKMIESPFNIEIK